MCHQISMYLYLIKKTDWKQASKEAIRRMRQEAKSGNRSSLRMASDFSFSISRSFIEQASFSSLSSENEGEDSQPDDAELDLEIQEEEMEEDRD